MKKMVVILLGNRMNDDGTISDIQKERLEMLLKIDQQFDVYRYILSGGMPNQLAGISEAEGMYNYLVEKGMDPNRLIKEDKSYSTVDNAKYSVPIAKELGADVIMVCSSSYHFKNPDYKLMESFVSQIEGTGMTLLTYTMDLKK